MDAKTRSKLDKRLTTWRDELINLSRTNRLLYFRHTKTASLEIGETSPQRILERLDGPSSSNWWEFFFPPGEDDPPREPRATELRAADKTSAEVSSALRLLERKANQDFVDKGLWTLYLGVGFVEWIDSQDEGKTIQSPILLVPVTFSRASTQEPFRLRRVDEDAVINPALIVKLENDFGIQLAALDDAHEIDVTDQLTLVGTAIKRQRGWSVNERVVLTSFTFHKEAMYRDLLENAEEIAENPLVQLLALGPESPTASTFDFDELPEELLDEHVPPEELVSVRDADSTQRRCIIAAREGRSFVMDGPPGTGKSQTITNLIAEVIKNGKSVLFVSEKAAALEVVHKRLKESRLDDFVLELHSHKATRKDVAATLGRALSMKPSARSRFDATSADRLALQRRSLSTYALAMNEVRQPLGLALHTVLGKIASLHEVPQAPVPGEIGTALTPEQLDHLLEQARLLGRNWGPVERADAFAWREVRETETSASRLRDLELRVQAAQEASERLQSAAEGLAAEVRLHWADSPADAFKLRELLTLIDERPQVPPPWLTTSSLGAVIERLDEQERNATEHERLANELTQAIGEGWRRLETGRLAELTSTVTDSGDAEPSWPLPDELSSDEMGGLAQAVLACFDAATTTRQVGLDLTTAFGMTTSDTSIHRLRQLGELGALIGSVDAPEPKWLSPVAQAGLTQAATVLGELLADFRQRQAALAQTFNASVLELDLPALRTRFAEVHRGMGKTRKAYREDKRAVAGCSVTGKVPKELLSRLDEAAQWADLARRLERAEAQHANVLGTHYYPDRDRADFDQITRAIEVAKKALELAGDDVPLSALEGKLSRSESPDVPTAEIARKAREALTSWDELAEVLSPEIVERLQMVPLSGVCDWLARAAGRLSKAAEIKAQAEVVAGRHVSVTSVLRALEQASAAQQIEEDTQSRLAGDQALLGPTYVGLRTDWNETKRSVSWTNEVTDICDGPLSQRTATAVLTTAARSADIETAAEEWEKATASLCEVFTDDRSEDLRRDLAGSFEDAEALLDDLVHNLGDIEVWDSFASSRKELSAAGLHAVVDFCIEHRVQAESVPAVIERAVLESWADAVVAADRKRLSPAGARERDALVREFQELDQALVDSAAARVISACNDRRPTSLVGTAGIIQKEAQKKRKHMPIRRLLSEAGSVAQQLKPCFMMSPLSVSQFLPPSLKFDVVVFDEASQVLPSDAINCVYRGEQLIVAGDENQLPPSSFFALAQDDDDTYDEDDVEDFESILKVCKASGGMRSLPLRWHYRSQSEDLITYSNYRFYDGGLHTFPGAAQAAADLGIEIFKVDGVYRRGAQRDNPVEAAAVVDRVLYHLHEHPSMTLGVVTFSAAQEDAVVVEIERRAAAHPELGTLLNDDRLNGFFVKNLENVQGDERDLIIFTIGYGPDENGKFTVQMGPLNKQGGWRRLNVAITRARRRVEIVTSVLAGAFPGDVTAPGVRHLQGYLDFADRGLPALALDLDESGRDAESVFEEEVLRTIRGWGYDAVPQVGLAGYRIDIGIRDPRMPGQFLFGVECDGAMYHSSKVARDRDRLRQGVLEGLGWKIHRIWGISWFRDRAGQEKRLREAIELALNGDKVTQAVIDRRPSIHVSHHAVDFSARPKWAIDYKVAKPTPPKNWVEMHDPNARPDIRRMVLEVARIEVPVHEDVVLRSIREAWGVGRAGHRIREAFDTVLTELTERNELSRDRNGFLRIREKEFEVVRVPTDDPASSRSVSQVPSEELDNAVYWTVESAHTIDQDALVTSVARLFGWGRVGSEISDAIEDSIDRMVDEGYVSITDGSVRFEAE
jgi:very-short-patch-repair endonuclease